MTASRSRSSPAPAATFCAGADLKAFGTERGEPGRGRRRRPDGPDPHAARQAGARRGRGLRGRGRARARALVRPARRGARRGVRRVLPALGRAADRRRHRPAPAPDRPVARARPHPHRARRRPATRRCAMGLANRLTEPGEALAHRGRRSPTSSPGSRRRACAWTGMSSYEQWDLPFDAAMDNELVARPDLDARAGPGGRPVRRRRGPPRRDRPRVRLTGPLLESSQLELPPARRHPCPRPTPPRPARSATS